MINPSNHIESLEDGRNAYDSLGRSNAVKRGPKQGESMVDGRREVTPSTRQQMLIELINHHGLSYDNACSIINAQREPIKAPIMAA